MVIHTHPLLALGGLMHASTSDVLLTVSQEENLGSTEPCEYEEQEKSRYGRTNLFLGFLGIQS